MDNAQSRAYNAISIHVLREEDDEAIEARKQAIKQFLSTSSARRTTEIAKQMEGWWAISIHVLREEDDCTAR